MAQMPNTRFAVCSFAVWSNQIRENLGVTIFDQKQKQNKPNNLENSWITNKNWKNLKTMLKSESDSVESEDFVISILRSLESKVEILFLKSTSANKHLKNDDKVWKN